MYSGICGIEVIGMDKNTFVKQMENLRQSIDRYEGFVDNLNNVGIGVDDSPLVCEYYNLFITAVRFLEVCMDCRKEELIERYIFDENWGRSYDWMSYEDLYDYILRYKELGENPDYDAIFQSMEVE